MSEPRAEWPFRTIFRWAVSVVALSMLALILVPIDVWHRPANEAVYEGFHPNLMYIDTLDGAVRASPDSLRLTAVPKSSPTVHLAATTMDFTAAMHVAVLDDDSATPLSVALWSPRKNAGYYLDFGPRPENLVTARTVVGDSLLNATVLGTYTPGEIYRLELSWSRELGTIQSLLRPLRPAGGRNLLELPDSAPDGSPRELHSDPVPVQAGIAYTLGANIKFVSDTAPYRVADAAKLAFLWLDSEKRPIGDDGRWRLQERDRWTAQEVKATAPAGAAYASAVLAAGDGAAGRHLLTDLYVRRAAAADQNLLPNGSLKNGSQGWHVFGPGSLSPLPEEPRVIEHSLEVMGGSVTADQVPDLFLRVPIALTVKSSSIGGLSSAELQDYSVTLPSQQWFAMRVDDARATGLVVALLSLGSILCIIAISPWAFKRARQLSLPRTRSRQEASALTSVPVHWPIVLGVAAAVLAYLVANALLFNLGFHPTDFISGRLWAYIGAHYGPTEIYRFASLTSQYEQWQGVPYGIPLFPYQPVLAYVYLGFGWIDRLLFADPGNVRLDSQLGFVMKSGGVLFTLADAALVYLILRQLNVNYRASLLSAALLLFNPAVWFLTSIYGSTHMISSFFLLASIWFATKRHPLGAWLALGLVVLTRTQLLLPAVLLALVYLRTFSAKETISGISWSVIVIFLMLGPFFLKLSPSFPIDFQHQLASELDPDPSVGQYYGVSIGAYNLWPLLTKIFEGAAGPARFHIPRTESLAGSFTYADLSKLLFIVTTVVLAAAAFFNRRLRSSVGAALPLVATSQLALLTLTAGVAGTHFVQAIPLVILCRKYMRSFSYYSIVIALTMTTLVSSYGDFVTAIGNVEHLAPALHPSNNAVSRFVVDLHLSDWFITFGSATNLGVLFWMAAEATRPLLSSWRFHRPAALLGSSDRSALPVESGSYD